MVMIFDNIFSIKNLKVFRNIFKEISSQLAYVVVC